MQLVTPSVIGWYQDVRVILMSQTNSNFSLGYVFGRPTVYGENDITWLIFDSLFNWLNWPLKFNFKAIRLMLFLVFQSFYPIKMSD